MKALPVIFTAFIVGLIVFFVQQNRINELEDLLAESKVTPSTSNKDSRSSSSSNRSTSGLAQSQKPSQSTRRVSEDSPARASADQSQDNSPARSMNRIFESEAGQAMMKQGIKQAIPQFYGDFIESLELNSEEAEYFNNLLTERMSSQQLLGMEWLKADEQGRLEIGEKMEAARLANTEQIDEFLQSSEDSASFKKYEQQLPENRQMEGVRNALSDDPLAPDVERQLVDTLYEARLNSGEGTASDDENWEAIVSTGSLESIEARWQATDKEIASTVPDVLTPAQTETFLEHWKQARALIKMEYQMGMQLMGIQEKE